MLNLAWSIVLAVVGIVGLWLAGSRSRLGWALGLTAQALWTVFAIVTEQYAFILSTIAYGFVYGRNLRRWSRREDKDQRPLSDFAHGGVLKQTRASRLPFAEPQQQHETYIPAHPRRDR